MQSNPYQQNRVMHEGLDLNERSWEQQLLGYSGLEPLDLELPQHALCPRLGQSATVCVYPFLPFLEAQHAKRALPHPTR